MNLYEQFVFDELEKHNLAVFLPYKDRGVDCVVYRGDFAGRPQRIQIKGSRTYADGGGWYQFTSKALSTSNGVTDFWMFVSTSVGPRGILRPQFLIVPTSELASRLEKYAKLSGGKYNLYIAWNDPDHKGRVVDTRVSQGDPWPIPPGSLRDYTSYSNAWSTLVTAVGPD